jgi:superfamily II DNA or RNA helicase
MTALKDGTAYEEYVLKILTPKYKNIWMWKNIPKNIIKKLGFINDECENCDDIGCDILAELSSGEHDYIQCKNYSTGTDNTINICDLAGFYNFVAENKLSDNAYVYYSGKLSCQVVSRTKYIKYVNMPMINFKTDKLNCIPRDYQIEAYNILKSNKKSVLSMPCGTGKTLVEYLLSNDYKTTIILSPLISTTEQTLSHFKNYYHGEKINYVEISSDAGRTIKKCNPSDKNIIVSTYDSADIVNKTILKSKIINFLLIIDEFHNLTQNNLLCETSEIYDLMQNKCNILFVSATPKFFEDYDYGVKYELSWNVAIKNKYICDYNFSFPDNGEIEKEVKLIIDNIKFAQKITLVNKAYFLLKTIESLRNKKCLVYLKSISECTSFVKLVGLVSEIINLKIKVNMITCNTSKKNRIKILNEFDKCECVHVLCNVHILDEGIDIPKCDMVYVTNPTDNIISLIQRISRCNRLDSTNLNKIAHVLLWTKNNDNIKKITDVVEVYIKVNKSIKIIKENEIDDNSNNDAKIKMAHRYVCNACNYSTLRLNDITTHNLTKSHKIKCDLAENGMINKNRIDNSDNNDVKIKMAHKYICNACNYFTSRLNDITTHNLTKSHKIKCDLAENGMINKNKNA